MSQRYQLAVMEGVLEAAVQLGARIVSRQWRSVSSEMLFINGNARARGIRLDNYGIFFDVEVPSMRQSVAWTWRMLDREAGGASTALQLLKSHLKTVSDPAQRKELDQAIRRLELQIGPVIKPADEPMAVAQAGPRPGTAVSTMPGAPVSATPPAPGGAVSVLPITEDPGAAYTSEVKNALIDAMLDHSQALTIAENEWLTVAAHDDADPRMGGSDPYESVTMLFRLKGADLLALRAGRLTRDEARQRVEVKEY